MSSGSGNLDCAHQTRKYTVASLLAVVLSQMHAMFLKVFLWPLDSVCCILCVLIFLNTDVSK